MRQLAIESWSLPAIVRTDELVVVELLCWLLRLLQHSCVQALFWPREVPVVADHAQASDARVFSSFFAL